MFKKMLVYIDGNEKSFIAARYAIAIAKQYNIELYGIYVINLKVLDDLVKAKIFLPSEQEDYKKDMEEDGKKYLNYFKELAEEKKVPVETLLTKGNVSEEVNKAAKELNIDIIIVSEIKEMLSRSEAFYDEKENIIHRSNVPVLIVKKSKEEILEEFNKI